MSGGKDTESQPLSFIADSSLPKLAKYLRMLGIDCFYDGGISTPDLLQAAAREERILLTLKPLPETRQIKVFRIHESGTVNQLRELADCFSIEKSIDPLSRCLVCNYKLTPVSPEHAGSVPSSVIERKLELSGCPECKRIYWHGSHVDNILRRLEKTGLISEKSPDIHNSKTE